MCLICVGCRGSTGGKHSRSNSTHRDLIDNAGDAQVVSQEMWEIVNETSEIHNFHIHGVNPSGWTARGNQTDTLAGPSRGARQGDADRGRGEALRLGRGGAAGHTLEFLTDNGGAYIAHGMRRIARSLGLTPINTPVCSPQSNGMVESFVNTFRRDYESRMDMSDAPTVLAQLAAAFEHSTRSILTRA